jgi:KDO2-lipid IV(A) lauroyltransferase
VWLIAVLYYFYRFVVKIVSLLPYSLVLAIGRALGVLYYIFIKKQVSLARDTIRARLAVAPEEADEITRAMCRNVGMAFMEILYMPALNSGNIRQFVDLEREDLLQEAVAEKKGVIMLAIHMDNWEWLGAALSLYGYPLTSFIKKQPGESVNRILAYLRIGAGIELFTRGTSETVAAARALKKGKMLGFIADQDGGHEGIFVPFLGEMASTPAGPAFFARKFKAPIVPIFIVRKAGGGHKTIVGDKFYYEDTGDEQKDMYECTRKMTGIVEKVIREHPDNWLWFQRRWNTPYEARPKDVPKNA